MITIVIPSYNQQEFLPDALESALEQGCPVILVDDGSTDNSLEVARRYEKDNPLLKVVSQVNKGLPSARNTGIMWAKTKYVLFLDADDQLLENAVKRIQEVAEATDADIIAPSFRCFGVGNDIITLMPNPTLEDFKVGNRIGYCAAVKREALLECGGYSPRMTWGWEDLHLWRDLLSRGKKIETIPEVLWLYRTKENSMIHEANKHAEELSAQLKKDFPQIYA